MNTVQLRNVLQAVVAAIRESPTYLFIPIELHKAETEPTGADPRMVALIEALRAEPELETFNEKVQIIADSPETLSYQALASWLISRASETNSDQALADLTTYLQVKEFPGVQNLVFSDLSPQPAQLGHGISIQPYATLPDSRGKRSFRRTALPGPLPEPTGALVRSVVIPRRHLNEDEVAWSMILEPPDGSDLHDAMMCIGLVQPPVPQIIGYWIDLPEWVPMTLPVKDRRSQGFSSPRTLTADEAAKARDLFAAFCRRSKDRQAHIRLVMNRLSQMPRRSIVDAAIDLGIAFQALYLRDLQDDRGELTFRLRIRAARFLATNTAERKRISDLIGKLYKVRSTVVHTGKLPPKNNARSVRQLLEAGSQLATDTVRRLITTGEPDWDSILFG